MDKTKVDELFKYLIEDLGVKEHLRLALISHLTRLSGENRSDIEKYVEENYKK